MAWGGEHGQMKVTDMIPVLEFLTNHHIIMCYNLMHIFFHMYHNLV